MIRIICGGKKNAGAFLELITKYEKRLRKPFEVSWEFYEESKLMKKLEEWPFERASDFVICCDERGEIISSDEYSAVLTEAFASRGNVVVLIGGAYGFDESVRRNADMVWSFSKLVFPHQLFRVMVIEQVYRASQIASGGPYHHQ